MRRFLLALSALALVTGTARAQVPISTCGSVVPAKQVGVLQTDLDCPTSAASVPYATAGAAPSVVPARCRRTAPTR